MKKVRGINKQLTNMNHAMMEMLSGRAVRVGAATGGVGYAVEVRSAEVVRLGGGGVSEWGIPLA